MGEAAKASPKRSALFPLSFQTFQILNQVMHLGRWIIRLTGLVEILKLLGIADGLFQFMAYSFEDAL